MQQDNFKLHKRARRLVEKMLPPEVKAGALQDFDHKFQSVVDMKGRFAAYCWFWIQILQMLPSIIKDNIQWSSTMLKNYLKIALRNIKRHKGYSFINIFGLTLATAACIFIILYLHYELSYDKHYKNSSNIFRITNNFTLGDTHRNFATIPGPAGPAFTEGIPEMLDFTRAVRISSMERKIAIKIESDIFEESGVFLADSTFFNIFDHEFLVGDSHSALNEPNNIVMTEKSAKKLFGDDNPLGKVLSINGFRIGDLRVTGIIKDLPANTHFKFNYLISYNSISEEIKKRMMFEDWGYFSFYTYAKLDRNSNIDEVVEKMNMIYDKNSGEQHRKIGAFWNYDIQKMTDIHLKSHISGELEANNNIEYIYLQSVVAILIMVIACSNFINLFIARSTTRAKEVGLRKVFGAVKRNIKDQILGESAFQIIISIIAGLILVIPLLPIFNSLTGLSLSVSYIFHKQILFSLFVLIVVASLLAGIYPSIVLSRFQPITTIKSSYQTAEKKNFFRQSLVAIQFIISIGLIFSSIVVLKQLDFMKNKNLGFSKEQVLVVNVKQGRITSNGRVFKELLKMNPDIIEASFSNTVPGKRTGVNAFLPEGFNETDPQMLEMVRADFDFQKTYELEVVQGRAFLPEMGADSGATYMLNESAVRLLGWSNEEAIGKSFDNMTNENKNMKVIGIVRDYHHKSLKEVIDPMVFSILPRVGRYLSIKVSTSNLSGTLSYIEEKWNEYTPGLDFEYFFVDENFDSQYRSEEKLFTMFEYFAVLAILISGLGLFALAAYTAEQKTKEIGIRKVLGAKISELIIMLLRSSLSPVILASIITLPVVYYGLNMWLQNFAFKIEMNIWWYIISIVSLMLLSLVTTAYQTIKAAKANPVDSLRYE